MITIRFRKKSDEYLSFEVDGHAEYADPGEDIVCAGVSAIAFMGINALLEVAKFLNQFMKLVMTDMLTVNFQLT